MTAFTVVWAGQLVSLLGSAMTQFGITLYVFKQTEQATSLALMGFFTFLPLILFSPTAGALVDRWNRKLVMMLSDIAGGTVGMAIFLLYSTGHLHIWHLYVGGFVIGTFQAFQWPAYSAAISTMIPKEQYARASGMMSLAESASQIGAPILAAALLGFIGLQGILLVDIASFLIAISTLAWVSIPQPKESQEGQSSRGSLLQESVFGFRYILWRPPLLGLQTVFLFVNLATNFGFTVMAAMILSRTGQNQIALGSVESAAGIGGVLGGLLLTAWGGPKCKVQGVLFGMALGGLLGAVPMGLGQSLPVWMAAAFVGSLIGPILNGSNQAIWQSKVPPDIQGKVFSARRMIAWMASPIAMLLAGPAADHFFTPAMMPGGALADTFGPLVGVGPGAGMGLMLVIAGLAEAAFALAAYTLPFIRNAEDLIPDHDGAQAQETSAQEPVPAS
ncbi:MAG: MFS transporter [Meiothermus sp.]